LRKFTVGFPLDRIPHMSYAEEMKNKSPRGSTDKKDCPDAPDRPLTPPEMSK